MTRRKVGTNAGGYVVVNGLNGHPMADKNGRTYEHRLVLFDAGVEIPPGYHVHHKNGDKTDNRLENLEAKPASLHHKEHRAEQGYGENQYGRFPLRTGEIPDYPCYRCGETDWYIWKKTGQPFCRSCRRIWRPSRKIRPRG